MERSVERGQIWEELQVVFEVLEIYSQGERISKVGDVTHPCRESTGPRKGGARDAARASLRKPSIYTAATL